MTLRKKPRSPVFAALKQTSLFMMIMLASNQVISDEIQKPEKLTNEQTAELIEDKMTADEIRQLRNNSIREAVYAVSMQKAVNDRNEEIVAELEKQALQLDTMYDFNPFLLENGRVLPPIITEAQESMKLVDESMAVTALTTYKIDRPARIVSTAPSWRDYLITLPMPVRKINPLLEPKTEEEKLIWAEANQAGTLDGIEQANQIFEDGVARLTRDMAGAARFKRLVKQQIITKPTLATGRTPVEVEGETMTVGKTVYRLTEKATYQSQEKWKARPSLSTNR